VRIGVVGCGLIAQVAHLPALRALDELFDVVALADPCAGVRERLGRRYGVACTVATHEELLDSAAVDAVLICSPNGHHARATLDALDARCHVLVEKPLCLTSADADAIVERAARTGLTVQVGYMKRFDPAYEALAVGSPVRHVTSMTVDPGIGVTLRPPGLIAPPDATDGFDATAEQVARAVGSDDPRHLAPFSGAFLGALIHDVNLVRGLLDRAGEDVVRVTDAGAMPGGTLAFGACELSGGGRWTAGWALLPGAASFREEIRIFTDDGVASLVLPAPYLAPTQTYARELQHFHGCIVDGAECRTPASQAAGDIALLTEMYRTAIAA
jgi:predicted dehydrogenase